MNLPYADPLPQVITHLLGHPGLTAALGGPGRVGDGVEQPYPRLRVTDPPGGRENLTTGIIRQRIRVEALGVVDGPSIGKKALRDILYVALQALAELPAAAAGTAVAVITDVTSASGGGYAPMADGRPRYIAEVTVTAHPGP